MCMRAACGCASIQRLTFCFFSLESCRLMISASRLTREEPKIAQVGEGMQANMVPEAMFLVPRVTMQTVLLTPVRHFLPVPALKVNRSSRWRSIFVGLEARQSRETTPQTWPGGDQTLPTSGAGRKQKTQETRQPTLKSLLRCLPRPGDVACQSTRPIVVAARQVQTAVLRPRPTSARLRDL
ncbi:hypothetical protein CGRA01v4_11610 [Colletotrichum graminicola]|nr:hypothetical protein CGRA01v4_11610 [Colletotrichum graminicola]